jgi:hypothetical protein
MKPETETRDRKSHRNQQVGRNLRDVDIFIPTRCLFAALFVYFECHLCIYISQLDLVILLVNLPFYLTST